MTRSPSRAAAVANWRRPSWRIKLVAMSCSIVAHAALLLTVGLTYHPVQTFSPQRNPPSEMSLLELATVPSALPPPPPTAPKPRTASESLLEDRPWAIVEAGADHGAANSMVELLDTISDGGARTSSRVRHPLFWSGFRDPRLRRSPPGHDLDSPGGSVFPPSARQLSQALESRITADDERALAQRQMTILGRRLTVFGDSSAYHSGLHWNIAGRRATLPVDGRDWEDRQMRAQRDAFVRDSLLRESIESRQISRRSGR